MTEAKALTPEALIERVRSAPQSDFYRNRWGAAQKFSSLPLTSRADFARTALSKRRYKDEKSLVKIVHSEHGAFLSEWSFPDIDREEYGVASRRPMVYLRDSHDAIEKSFWCYERGMVPLIGEKNTAVAMSAAMKYGIDSLICDLPSLRALQPYFEKRREKLRAISLVGTFFPLDEIHAFCGFAERVRLVLALPETGAFAEADFTDAPEFKALPGCLIEHEERLVLTKLSLLATPLIRYDTGIGAKHIIAKRGRDAAFESS